MKKLLVSFAVFAATAGFAHADGLIISPSVNVTPAVNVAVPVQQQVGVAVGVGVLGTGAAASGLVGGQNTNATQTVRTFQINGSFNH